MTIVTALRPTPAGIVVELDGVVWRTLPVDAVVDAGLGVGLVLDRARAVALARARRRSRADDVAVRAIARREHSRTTLDARLARAGVGATVRRETVERAERSGLVDDGRFAVQRAQHLAARGAGDALVRDDLARQGIDEPVARSIVAELEPEAERAAQIVAAHGRSPRTIRYLASKGFSEETLEPLIAEIENGALG
jgi:regulatory protein